MLDLCRLRTIAILVLFRRVSLAHSARKRYQAVTYEEGESLLELGDLLLSQ